MKVLAATIGNCVHVGGVQAFLDIARSLGHETVFLGTAVSVQSLVAAVKELRPDVVALSYRLSPESARPLLEDLKAQVSGSPDLKKLRYLFGGTPPVVELARATGTFSACFDGTEDRSAVIGALTGKTTQGAPPRYAEDLVSRIGSSTFPLIRHHFGQPSLEKTIEGAARIAESGLLDILSIAPDQNAQESFFRTDEMDTKLDGAGGVPLRTPDDLRAIYSATRRGNHPLLRCYSGTRELVKWGEMLKDTIKVAWGAVPLTWYSELDGRSKRSLSEAVRENQAAIKWYAENGVPVEVNESHQWALRRSGDVVEVATAYIAAHNAKALGVRDYVCQFMFDTPRGISPAMDLAKMLAKIDLIQPLSSDRFRTIRMVRSGLSSLSPDPNIAKGQLASSVYSSMTIQPQIVHVVGFSEGDHAATAEEVIESCAIARGAIMRAMLGKPDVSADPRIAARRVQLGEEARMLVEAIRRLRNGGSDDSLASPAVLAEAVKEGLLDATDLRGSKVARGRILTDVVDGACVALNPATRLPLPEKERIQGLAVSDKDLDLAEM
ncbi:MAG: cobalamin B12-binding domain-containing protein [Thermoplasmata archaeon]|nr:cobalamin B12-binding domain-containing protein [Thermoplasmata archaeon]